MADAQSVSWKRCPKCGGTKSLGGDFHRNKGRADGHSGHCKACMKVTAAAWRVANLDRCLDVEERWRAANPEYGAAWYKANRARHRETSDAWKKAHPEKVAEYEARRRRRHPDRVKARTAAGNAIKAGKLIRKPCEELGCGLTPKIVNGRQRIEAHHHKGYEKRHWLDVKWLCRPHHRAADAALEEE